jgi:hypothetical protein
MNQMQFFYDDPCADSVLPLFALAAYLNLPQHRYALQQRSAMLLWISMLDFFRGLRYFFCLYCPEMTQQGHL